ncbi:uncharacterized protein LOC141852274 [Brevipalpus obovatus]|uniref:uncharacterized protein LOC141852274 n=1 Tax=Brevipalpus obovatus TaxID=246614 RepID=UPI003D9E8D83
MDINVTDSGDGGGGGGGIGDLNSNKSISYKGCLDSKGNLATHGDRYFPHGDPCRECQCQNGEQSLCRSVLCQPPPHCINPKPVPDACCQFICVNFNISGPLDPRSNPQLPPSHGLGLRLIASTVTSFLILALLLFMMHRLRQRRLLLMIRRLQNRRLEHNLSANDGCFPVYDQTDFALRGTFLDPPPPYAFWKPPETFLPPIEAPPPYEESVLTSIIVTAPQPEEQPVNNNHIPRLNERSTTTTGTSPIRSHTNSPFVAEAAVSDPQVCSIANHHPTGTNFETSSSSSYTSSSHSVVPSPSNTSSDSS